MSDLDAVLQRLARHPYYRDDLALPLLLDVVRAAQAVDSGGGKATLGYRLIALGAALRALETLGETP